MIRRLLPCLCLLAVLLHLLGVGSLPSDAARSPASGLGPRGEALAQVVPRGGAVYEENQRPGTTRWKSAELVRTAERQRLRLGALSDPHLEKPSPWGPRQLAPAAPRDAWVDTTIRGYANLTSVNRGGTITLYVSTTQAHYELEVYRMGWYGGTGARLIQESRGRAGQNQPVPTPQPTTGLIVANWQASYTLQTGVDWVSGIYLVKLIAEDQEVSYIPFVLRDDGVAADILYQVPFNTYQAYNNWGGKSLYDYQSTGGRAYKVSFDRPYERWSGAGNFFQSDYGMIRFLESQGYNITYVSSLDTQTNPGMFSGRKLFLTSYHDEYWSRQMRDNVTAARDAGRHLAFFSANNVYWQVRFESSASGVPNRVMVCYKDASLDPLSATSPSLTTVQFRDPPVNQPENALLGVMFESLFNYGTAQPWVVANASHWVYSGTGLANGDRISELVGYDYDRVYNNGHSPANLQVLAASPW